MRLLGREVKGTLLAGLAVGVGALVIAPAAVSVVARAAWPLAKAAVKGGMVFYGTRSRVAAGAVAVKGVTAAARAIRAGVRKA